MKNSYNTIRNRTLDLPTFSATAPPHATGSDVRMQYMRLQNRYIQQEVT